MDTTIPYLRTQSDLLTELNVEVRDTGNSRWSAAEKYNALNKVLMTWHEQVRFAHIYTISGGWQVMDYDYALPSYVRPPIIPQMYRRVPYQDYIGTSDGLTRTWQDLPGWETEPDGSGGLVLRLFAPPRALEGRVLYYAPNSRVPTTIPTTSGSTSDTATTMTIGSAIDVDDNGYVKVDAEYIMYNGVTRGASTTVLNNLVRAQYGSTAATHNTSSNVTWCVAMDDMRLNKLLFDQWKSLLHAFFIQDGGVHERGMHEKALGYYDQMAANFWPQYVPHRKSAGLTLNRKSFILR